jgi:hypothetical protein
MVTTYFLHESDAENGSKRSSILRIIDRDRILTSTDWGCVYINRECAARILREYRRRRDNPLTWNGKQAQFVEYEKNVTP